MAPFNPPPGPVLIVPINAPTEIAADSSWQDVIKTVDLKPQSSRQHYLIIPEVQDGKQTGFFIVKRTDGRVTTSDNYDSEVRLSTDARAAYHWAIDLKSDGLINIRHRNGKLWTLGRLEVPIELTNDAKPAYQDFDLVPADPNIDPGNPDTGEPTEGIHARDAPKLIITGPLVNPRRGRQPPARLEINDFIINEKFFSLYIQALLRVYDTPEDDLTSFYQIAGLHGFPLVHWNQSNTGSGSYCRHKSVLFPTWHRPYVALFEQVVQAHARNIAASYTTADKDEWVTAAYDLRQPYWDWAKTGGAIPPEQVFIQETVRITRPDGEQQWVDNPFLRYRFKSSAAITSFPKEYAAWPTTIRDPYSKDAIADIKSRLLKAQEYLTTNTHHLFSILTWDEFSNKAETQSGATNSLEALHDSIHILAGRNGHFSSACGAFDPMFFLHHSQVDRLLAFWCSIHTDYVPGSDIDKDVNIDTDLSPFWNSNTTYWTSKTVRNHEMLGYTYPEYLNVKDDLRQHLIRIIDDLYGEHNRRTFDFLYNPNAPITDSHDAWSVRIRIKPFEIDRSYAVAVFLDSVPPDASEWVTSPNLVGSFDVFINYSPAECENCRDHQEVRIEGFVHLTAALKRGLNGRSLRDWHTVESELEKRLYIGIQKVDGTILFVNRVEWTAEVVSIPVKLHTMPGIPRNAHLPFLAAGDITTHSNIHINGHHEFFTR